MEKINRKRSQLPTMRITLLIAINLFIQLANGQSSTQLNRELHVAKNGLDAGKGSATDPFLTINHAAQEAQPGDKIIIHKGVYREQITLTRGGTSENLRITFMAAPGESVMVKGSELISSWKPLGNGVWQSDISNTSFGQQNPFTTFIKNQTVRHLGEVYVDDLSYSEQSTLDAVKASVGSWFAKSNEDSTRIWVNFGKINPRKKMVEVNNRSAAFVPEKPGVNYITLDGIKITQVASNHASFDSEQPGAISTRGGIHWIIQNCEISNVKCVGISLAQPNGRDTSRHSPVRPSFGEFENINEVGRHIVRNNFIHHCGQAGIFSLLHGTRSEILDNQIEDIRNINGFSIDHVSGIYLAVAVDATVERNLIRRIENGSGITLGPLYQGTRITRNIIVDIGGSPLYFFRSHGLALIDNNIIVGHGTSNNAGGIKLRGAEANVFVHNLFVDCAFTSESLSPSEASGTINYKSHSLITKQTIPATTLDNRWFNNIFIRGGLASLAQDHGEADNNIYMEQAAQSTWGDSHSNFVLNDGDFKLTSTTSTVNVAFDLDAFPKIQSPIIDADFIGRFALSQTIESPDGTPLKLVNDFFGNTSANLTGFVGPFVKYPSNKNKTMQVFQRLQQTRQEK